MCRRQVGLAPSDLALYITRGSSGAHLTFAEIVALELKGAESHAVAHLLKTYDPF